MQEELDDPGAIAVQMPLEVNDGAVALIPDLGGRVRNALCVQKIRMNPYNQNILVVRAIEYADLPPLRQHACRTPQKIVFEFRRAWRLEAVHPATLWINAGHHVANDAVFARSVHPLQDHEQRMLIRRVVQLLQLVQLLDVLPKQFMAGMLRLRKIAAHRSATCAALLLTLPQRDTIVSESSYTSFPHNVLRMLTHDTGRGPPPGLDVARASFAAEITQPCDNCDNNGHSLRARGRS